MVNVQLFSVVKNQSFYSKQFHLKFFFFFFRELVVKGTFSTMSKNIGHYPHWEDPDGFMAAYEHFLVKVISEE